MKISDLEPLEAALVECRKKHRLTQQQMGAALGISRKVYHLFENKSWLPPSRERAHFVKRLYQLDWVAAETFVRVLGTSFEDYVLVRQPPEAAGKPIDAKQAKLVLDAALYATAEELDMNPKTVRPIAAGLLGRLAESGITLGQAAAHAKGDGGGKKTRTT